MEMSNLKKDRMDEDQVEEIVLCGIAFPKYTVKSRADFTIQKELGTGAFGTVYQGYLDMGPIAR